MREHNDTVTAYFFGDGPSGRRGLIGIIQERGPFLGLLMLLGLIIGGLGLYMWSQQETYQDGVLVLITIFLLGFVGSYVWLVMEMQVTPQGLWFRRLTKFWFIPWENILRLKVYSLRTTGITYVWITGRSGFPVAFFPLWVPGYRPERMHDLNRLVEHLSRYIPVKHTF